MDAWEDLFVGNDVPGDFTIDPDKWHNLVEHFPDKALVLIRLSNDLQVLAGSYGVLFQPKPSVSSTADLLSLVKEGLPQDDEEGAQ